MSPGAWRSDLYDRLFAAKDYAAEALKLRLIIESRSPRAQSLLDVACGTGRHLEALRRWYSVEGLDSSPEMLTAARRRLPDVPLHVEDMSGFDLGRSFDVVTCLFSAIACLPTRARLGTAVGAMTRHLNDGGLLIIEPWDEPPTNPAPTPPWLQRVDDEQGTLVCVESTQLEGDYWHQDSHYLLISEGVVEHVREKRTLGAFCADDYAKTSDAGGLSLEHDPVGLNGRGLFIGRRADVATLDPS
ncbi:MAG: class I SAM-dependent methyltransferase [Chloroflexi bacterium]|nr:class I SAM-dependent methyltransferase [Chloroflexota bacterium]